MSEKWSIADGLQAMATAIPQFTIPPDAVMVFEDTIGAFTMIIVRGTFNLRDDTPNLNVQMAIPQGMPKAQAPLVLVGLFNSAIENAVDPRQRDADEGSAS